MKATGKRLLAAVGAQGGAFVVVLVLGGFAHVGTPNGTPPTPAPTVTITITRAPASSPVPTPTPTAPRTSAFPTSTKHSQANPARTNNGSGNPLAPGASPRTAPAGASGHPPADEPPSPGEIP